MERKLFHYPPFVELATLRYKNIDLKEVQEFIGDLKEKLERYNN
jgi:primosomal protein N'